MLETNVDGRTYHVFLVRSPYGLKIDVYLRVKNGCVFYQGMVEQLRRFGCRDNEVVSLLPKREAYFINLLLSKGVLKPTKRFSKGTDIRQPIYRINLVKAEEVGLNIYSQNEVLDWQDKQNELVGRGKCV